MDKTNLKKNAVRLGDIELLENGSFACGLYLPDPTGCQIGAAFYDAQTNEVIRALLPDHKGKKRLVRRMFDLMIKDGWLKKIRSSLREGAPLTAEKKFIAGGNA